MGLGTVSPLGKTHIYSGSSGVTTVNANADELVLDSSGNVGLTLACPNTGNARINFSDPEHQQSGMIQYDHSTNALQFNVNAAERLRIDSPGRMGRLVVDLFCRLVFLDWYRLKLKEIQVGLTLMAIGTTSSVLFLRLQNQEVQIFQTIVQSGDVLGQISFGVADGSDERAGAFIRALVDGTPGTNDMPGRIVLATTADGASSPTERLRIDTFR